MLQPILTWLLADATLPTLPLAFVLGALVGAEREWRMNVAAGLRCCVLVSVASAAFADLMVTRVDVTNLGAGFGAIATGVGFLGAGSILREGPSVRGLSTAATIWCVAAIGAQAGAGEVIGAVWLTILVLLINILLMPVQRLVGRLRSTRRSSERDDLDSRTANLARAEILWFSRLSIEASDLRAFVWLPNQSDRNDGIAV